MKRSKLDLHCEVCDAHKDSVFAGMCSQKISQLDEKKSSSSYKKGQMLFHEGTRPMGIFCINKGKVKVFRLGGDGKEQIINILKGGDILGYKAMLSDELYPVSAETLEDSNICFIPKTNFLTILEDSPDLYQRLLKKVCHEMGVMTEHMTNLAQKSVRERLALTLVMLNDTYGVDAMDNGKVIINLTREDLANIVGTATETLIRLLHDFKEEKLVATEGRRIKILEPKQLAEVGGIV
ncbi:MAG: Crp/Fnr family transcriptional regulator [Cryomorphaceae bacterium]|nr:MAG: Crp/Fnr family transcriptional regulator [Cryomorphaceae bacterium]